MAAQPQKDCLNLSFVKDLSGADGKMARNGHKVAIYELNFFSYKIEKNEKTNKCVTCHSF